MRPTTAHSFLPIACLLAGLQLVAGDLQAGALQTSPAPQRRVSTASPDGEWTPWLNRDAPGGSGDYETLRDFVAAGQACPTPRAIECRTTDGRDWATANQRYTCDVAQGGICRNADQARGGRCLDYQVRFLCPTSDALPEQGFREKARHLEPLLEAARAGAGAEAGESAPLLRWKQTWQTRVGPEGSFEAYPAALLAWADAGAEPNEAEPADRAILAATAWCDKCVVQGRWTYRGPDRLKTQNQGIVEAIWVAPDDPDKILAGAGSGLWATTDGGATWKNLTSTSKHLRLVGVLDIAVNPTNQKEIVIGTGLGLSFSDLDRSYGFGVFRTTNGGHTWSPAPLADLAAKHFPASHRVLYHPLDPKVLYAALGPEVYKSVDGGKSWALLFEASFDGKPLPVRDLAVRPHPGSNDEVFVATTSEHKSYASTPSLCATQDPWTYIWATTNKSYCEIRYAAHVWKLKSPALQTTLSGLPVDLTAIIPGYESSTTLTAVEITPNGAVVAAEAGLLGQLGQEKVVLFKEVGPSWTKTTASLGTGINYGFTLKLAVSKADPDVLYLSGLVLMKSTDGGSTFSTMGQGYWSFLSNPQWAGSHPDVRAVTLQGQGPQGDVVFFGTDGGVSRTIDGLQSTENLNGEGLHLAQVHGLGITEARPGLIVFGTQHNGFFTNREYLWSLDPGGDFYDATVFESGADQVTALTTLNSSPIRTAKEGKLPLGSETCPESTCMNAELATMGDRVYLGRSSVWRRLATGGSWTKVATLPGCSVSGMAPSTDGKVLYVTCGGPLWSPSAPATFQGKVYRISSPAGATPVLSDVTSGLSAVAWQPITDVATNADGSVAYVSLGGFGDGVFRYETGGSWAASATGLPKVPVNALAYDLDSDSLFAGTDVGVYLKTPFSKGWLSFSGDAPFTLVSDLEIDSASRTLVAATFGHGAWSVALATSKELVNYCRPLVADPPVGKEWDAPW